VQPYANGFAPCSLFALLLADEQSLFALEFVFGVFQKRVPGSMSSLFL
jgi:hypothetical protein